MQIRLNGEARNLDKGVPISVLLDELGLDRDRVAVELNRRILKRAEFEDVTVDDGDEVEVVTFVGGG